MANTGHKGISVRQTGNRLLFLEMLRDSTGTLLATGTTSLSIQEWQSDGTVTTYDFNDNTFKSTAATTETVSMTHRATNNGTTNTGIWSYVLTTLTGFTSGAIYTYRVRNTGASPLDLVTVFQYGSAEGDLVVLGTAVDSNLQYINDTAVIGDGAATPWGP